MQTRMSDNRIVGVALRLSTLSREVLSLPAPNRHHNVINYANLHGYSLHAISNAEQGFILKNGQFVGREAAMRIAQESGQCLDPAHPTLGLFSEDLW